MKKFIAMLVAAACTLGAMATEYTGKLGVSVNGEGMSQETTITVFQQEDGNYTLQIKNFCLVTAETTIGVGDIVLTDVEGVEECGFTVLKVNKNITIVQNERFGRKAQRNNDHNAIILNIRAVNLIRAGKSFEEVVAAGGQG